MKWMPIETAPKDGSRIITYDGSEVRENRWFNFDVTGCFPGSDAYCRWHPQESPTHWMPLPEPPQSLSASSSADER